MKNSEIRLKSSRARADNHRMWSVKGVFGVVGALTITAASATIGDVVASAEDVKPPADVSHVGSVSADQLAYDMFGAPYRADRRKKDGVTIGQAPWGAHEAVPARGAANWDWYNGARFGASAPWNDYVTPWGQLFAVEGNSEWDVRLHVREVRLMYLDSAGTWHDLAGDVSDIAMRGTFWDAKFAPRGATDGQKGLRDESANGGGWSVRLSSMKDRPDFATWHWFYDGALIPRPKIPADAQAVFAAAQMRLITDGGDPADASFIASFGADHWPSAKGSKPPGKQITALFQPRMKYVDDEWTWFSGHTFAEWFDASGNPIPSAMGGSSILRNPPPIAATASNVRIVCAAIATPVESRPDDFVVVRSDAAELRGHALEQAVRIRRVSPGATGAGCLSN